jgi:DNA-binding transcriptional LysR family regulator
MGVEPNDLLLFARIVEAGSFSMAAQRLDLPKSTVSRRIALLEPASANACCSGPHGAWC